MKILGSVVLLTAPSLLLRQATNAIALAILEYTINRYSSGTTITTMPNKKTAIP